MFRQLVPDPWWMAGLACLLASVPAWGQSGPVASPEDHPLVASAQSNSPAAGPDSATPPVDQVWNLHFQSTVGAQAHPSFPAEYTGVNSLTPGA